MKAMVLFSPVVNNKNIGMFNKIFKYHKFNPLDVLRDDLKENRALFSEILLLPVYVKGLEFVNADKNLLAPFVLYKGEAKKGREMEYLQFVEGTSVKITGTIVSLDMDETENGSERLTSGIFKYGKMGSEKKKLFRQKTGKTLIKYLSNLIAINQLTNWAHLNNEEEEKKEKREPSKPVPAYAGISKSMTVIYFNDNQEPLKKTDAGEWEKEREAEREYRYQQAQKKLEVINKRLDNDSKEEKGLNQLMREEIKKVEEREMKRNDLLKMYGSQEEMESRYNALDGEIKAIDTQITGITTPTGATETEKEEIENQKQALMDKKGLLEEEQKNIKETLKKDAEDMESLVKLRKMRAEINQLIERKKEIEKTAGKSKEEYEAEKEQQDLKEWMDTLLGIELGLPVRYMYIPEVEVVSYAESMELDEKSEGTFELIVRQSVKNSQYVRVGDPVEIGMKVGGGVLGKIWDIIKGAAKTEEQSVPKSWGFSQHE